MNVIAIILVGYVGLIAAATGYALFRNWLERVYQWQCYGALIEARNLHLFGPETRTVEEWNRGSYGDLIVRFVHTLDSIGIPVREIIPTSYVGPRAGGEPIAGPNTVEASTVQAFQKAAALIPFPTRLYLKNPSVRLDLDGILSDVPGIARTAQA